MELISHIAKAWIVVNRQDIWNFPHVVIAGPLKVNLVKAENSQMPSYRGIKQAFNKAMKMNLKNTF